MVKLSRVLLTNDDGIDAPGLQALERIAKDIAEEYWIVAPLLDQSGTSHSVTLNQPLRVIGRGSRRFAINGTPSDCVAIALNHLMGGLKPDLVLSGVNRGANVADDVAYSGTVGAAVTAGLLGYRAAALSQAYKVFGDYQWETACHHAPRILSMLAEEPWPEDTCYNINFPNVAPDLVTHYAATRQGQGTVGTIKVDKRTDLRQGDYYWLAFQRRQPEHLADSDFAAMENHAVSVTPLRLDRTYEAGRSSLQDALDSVFP